MTAVLAGVATCREVPRQDKERIRNQDKDVYRSDAARTATTFNYNASKTAQRVRTAICTYHLQTESTV